MAGWTRSASLKFDRQFDGWMNRQSKRSFKVWTVHYQSLSERFVLESAFSDYTDAHLPVLTMATSTLQYATQINHKL